MLVLVCTREDWYQAMLRLPSHIVLAATVTIVVVYSAPDPVIILPAFAASVLDATLDKADKYRACDTTSDNFTLYASAEQFTWSLNCMINNMALRDENLSATGCLDDRNGLTVTPRDFGGTAGVSVVNPDDWTAVQTVTFKSMIDNMTAELDYEKGVSVRGAPYDFRRWGDACYTKTYFQSLKELVEDTFTKNNNRRVRLLCHSMGCPVGRAFLVSGIDPTVDAAWRAKYMAGLIAIGPPWAGSPQAIQSVIDGPVYSDLTPGWATGYIGEYIGKATSTWAGLLSLLPAQIGLGIYDESEPLVISPSRNFTINDMKDMLHHVSNVQVNYTHYSINRTDLWNYMSHNLFTLSAGPGVDLDCIYLVDVDTPYGLQYRNDDFTDTGTYISAVKGDGTVPMISAAKPLEAWTAEGGYNVTGYPLDLGGTLSHMEMPTSSDVIGIVLDVLRASHKP